MAKRKRPPEAHEKARPTPERRKRGAWQEIGGKAAVERYLRDVEAHLIDALEWRGIITQEQADAGRDFERLVRAATETPQARDSTTIWEPKGFENDDGNVKAVRDRRELYLFLGVYRDRLLRRACVNNEKLKLNELQLLPEALNECVRFFSHGGNKKR